MCQKELATVEKQSCYHNYCLLNKLLFISYLRIKEITLRIRI